MLEKLSYDTQNYADVQGLERLRYAARTNSGLARHEVAKQFEAYFFQIALKSMSEANKALSGGLFSSDQMDFYDDLFSKQLSLEIANHDLGFTKFIEQNMSLQYPTTNTDTAFKSPKENTASKNLTSPVFASDTKKNDLNSMVSVSETPGVEAKNEMGAFSSPREFVEKLWNHAKAAAEKIKIDPRVLIAQAALETNWGRKILPDQNNVSSHNLFNIKADAGWNDKSISAKTLEENNGTLKQTTSRFRMYESFKESFEDYIKFIKENGRYQNALQEVHNSMNYLQELQKAGFATDSRYAAKIHDILNSDSFNSLINNMVKNI